MTSSPNLKYIFWFFAAVLLVVLLYTCRMEGISCDEVLHYNHSLAVYNYFTTHGADQSALNTPVSSLKYYGQSYDNIVTFLTKWFGIEDVYGFRHIMSAIAGWLGILITALFAVWLTDIRTGIFVLLLFAISPGYLGHSQNNLKDIPFALSYIASVFFTLRYLSSEKKFPVIDFVLMLIATAFSISIRAGGLIILCYYYLFLTLFVIRKYVTEKAFSKEYIFTRFAGLLLASVLAWFLAILLWPFALKSPIKNVIESYTVMAHFPSTFRQIFEGKVLWSDMMPWYYLPKSMLITIPVLVLAGIVVFIFMWVKKIRGHKSFLFSILVFTILFPLVFVVYEKSNVYSSWRQFLFVYPGIVIISAAGIVMLLDYLQNKTLKIVVCVSVILLTFHPLNYMINNKSFFYIYYNQLTGGLKGAYTNYETDYYFTGETEAARWLAEYLEKEKDTAEIKVKATYSVSWQLRKYPRIRTGYFRYEERSQEDWDYAIVTNRYISPFQLRKKYYPPPGTIHIIYADSVPVCAVVKRITKEDVAGYNSFEKGDYPAAVRHYENAVKNNLRDEMIFYNFAAALYNTGEYQRADSALNEGLRLNPDSEPILMYLGNIAVSGKRIDEAKQYYARVIDSNAKYFEAYVKLAGLYLPAEPERSRALLVQCLNLNPGYKPAVVTMADSYRQTNPDIARKYDELAAGMK